MLEGMGEGVNGSCQGMVDEKEEELGVGGTNIFAILHTYTVQGILLLHFMFI
jgi:hypothetical protein